MKDSTFIELLNLYVDQEISSEQAVLLEHEIATNPQRKKVYQQYCRMHRATEVLGASFKSEEIPSGSKLARAARNADDKIAQFPHRKASAFSWGWFTAGGLVAAAACATFVFMNLSSTAQKPAGSQVATVQKPPVLAPARNEAVATVATSSAQPFRPVLVARSLQQALPVERVMLRGTATASSLDWMNQVQIPAVKGLSIDDHPFDVKNALQQEVGTFRSQQPIQGRIEMGAFQFQR
jgi:anti-sigma factor RsiW